MVSVGLGRTDQLACVPISVSQSSLKGGVWNRWDTVHSGVWSSSALLAGKRVLCFRVAWSSSQYGGPVPRMRVPRERAKQTPFRTQPQKSRSIVFSAFYLSRQSQRPTQVYREKIETPPLDGALGGFWKWMCDWKYCHGHFWKMQTASNHMKGLISWSDILEKEVLFGSHKTWFWKLPVPITNCVMEPQCAHL